MKVAFIGLGNMGAGMAGCLQRAGVTLTVFNRSPGKRAPFIAAGARGASDLADAVKDADIVITSLMDDKSVLDSVRNGILQGMKPEAIHLGTTTVSPQCADELDELHRTNGTVYVAGPVVGRPDAAAAGELTSLLAGDRLAVSRVTPICQAYSGKVIHVGERPGSANTLKLCVNYTVLSIIEAMGEVYSFADKAGLNLDVLRGFLQDLMGHPALKMYANKLCARDFAGKGGFAMSGGLKDVKLMLTAADKHGVAFEIGKIAKRKMEAAIAAGMNDTDWSATYEITRQESGLL